VRLVLILADAELELAPASPDGTGPRTFGEVPVLDAFFHRHLVQGMPEGERRGRPDIVHQCLALCQGSALNRRGMLRVFVHTRQDQVIAVGPEARVPPNYVEFLLAMGRLLQGEEVKGFTVSERSFRHLMDEVNADRVVALTPSGEERDLREVLAAPGTVAAVMGAFPCGDYRSPVYELADVRVSLGPELLTVPAVLSEVLAAARR
jgi:rRNA small subunit pseudouridine methyltransferase Nep1